MTHRESVNASLEGVKAQFGEAQEATDAAFQNSQSIHLRLGSILHGLEDVLKLDPRGRANLLGVVLDSVQEAQSKVNTAHDSLAEVAQGTAEDSPLAQALRDSGSAKSAISKEETAGPAGVPGFTARVAEQMNIIEGAHIALMGLWGSADQLQGWTVGVAAFNLARVVPNIEEYQQGL